MFFLEELKVKEMDATLEICTLDCVLIEKVPHYKYLGIWSDDNLTFKTHIDNLSCQLGMQVSFLYRNRSCLPPMTGKQPFSH